MLDGALGIFFRLAASGLVPASWFRAVDPADIDKARRTGQLKLEIVSHCWRYAPLFDLSTEFPGESPHRSVGGHNDRGFTRLRDQAVRDVLAYFGEIDVPGVRWNWRELPKEQLFRRSIGRNLCR